MRWLVLLAVIGGVAAAVVVARARIQRKPEVGAVSDQWIAEHQADQAG
jgi:hypothetical protein